MSAALADGDAPNASPRLAHIEVPRTARFYTLGAGGPTTRTVCVALHGYGQLAEYFARNFVPVATEAASGAALVIVPEALSRFYLPAPGGTPGGANPAARVGATWMTREDRLNEIGDYVRYLDRVLDTASETAGVDLARAPLAVLGFSQGTATACRWVAHRWAAGLAPAARVVLWGGGVPHDFDLTGADGDALRAAHLTLVAGDADEFASAAGIAEQEARLRHAGIAFENLRFAGGHRLHAETLEQIATTWDRS